MTETAYFEIIDVQDDHVDVKIHSNNSNDMIAVRNDGGVFRINSSLFLGLLLNNREKDREAVNLNWSNGAASVLIEKKRLQ